MIRPRQRIQSPWATALGAVLALAALAAGAAAGPAPVAAKPKPPARPNVIVVMTDDMPLSFLDPATTPNTIELLGNQGTTFTDSVVTTPLCCPSRASFLTGQYGHNNGVLANRPGYHDLIDKRNTLPVWLNRAGYETIHVGRYLNGYKQVGGKRTAPGWDQWYSTLEPRNYYRYDVVHDGKVIRKGGKAKDYLTRTLNSFAVRTIREQARRRGPFYLHLDQLAPHDEWRESGGPCGGAAIPGPGDLAPFSQVPLPEPPDYNEEDISDKAPFIQALPAIDEPTRAGIEREWRCRVASMLEVDRGVQRIVAALAAKGELDQTMIVFTSDNGFYHGEHRVPFEKYLPYQEGIHVPLLIRFPTGVGAVPVVGQTVSNIDLTATIVELAGASTCGGKSSCRVMDGRSFLPLARGEVPDWVEGREIVVELDRRFGAGNLAGRPCFYQGVRTPTHIYVEYLSVPDAADGLCHNTHQVEFYDLVSDPFELQNLYPTKPATPERELQLQLAESLDLLRDCAGIPGRDPVPASGHYCE